MSTYKDFFSKDPKSFVYLLKCYITRIEQLEKRTNEYIVGIQNGTQTNFVESDMHRWMAEILISMTYEMANVLNEIEPEKFSKILEDMKRRKLVIQIEKMKGLRNAILHFPDDHKTFVRRQKDFTKYVQDHGVAVSVFYKLIKGRIDEIFNSYPDVVERFNKIYMSDEVNLFYKNTEKKS